MAFGTDLTIAVGSGVGTAATNNGTQLSKANADAQYSAAAFSLIAAGAPGSKVAQTASLEANGMAFNIAVAKLSVDAADPNTTPHDFFDDLFTVVGDGTGAVGAIAGLAGIKKVSVGAGLVGGAVTAFSLGFDFDQLTDFAQKKINALLGVAEDGSTSPETQSLSPATNAAWQNTDSAFSDFLNCAKGYAENSGVTSAQILNACTNLDGSLSNLWNAGGYTGFGFNEVFSGGNLVAQSNTSATPLLTAKAITTPDGSATITLRKQVIVEYESV